MPFAAVFFDLDPLGALQPPNIHLSIVAHCTSILLRFGVLSVFVMELTKGVSACLVFILMVLCAGIVGIVRVNEIVRKSSLVNDKIKIMKVYKQLQLWNQYTKQYFFYTAVPPLILFGILTLIVANYATIRLRHYIPPMIYPLMPFTSMLASTFAVTLIPKAGSVFVLSKILLQDMKGRFVGKYERRVAISLRPMGVACGSCGIITKDWTLGIMDSIVNHTITLLITF